MKKDSAVKRDTIIKKIPRSAYLILIVSVIFLVLALGVSVYAIIFRKDLLRVEEEPNQYVDGNIDLVLESSEVFPDSTEAKVTLSIYPEAVNPVSVGVVIFKYDYTKLKLIEGNLRDSSEGGLPDTNQFILHNVAELTNGTYVEPKENEVCATSGYVCFTIAYVKDTRFSVEEDNQKAVLADLTFKPAEGDTFSEMAGESLKFDFIQDKTSLGELEGAYGTINFNDLVVEVKR